MEVEKEPNNVTTETDQDAPTVPSMLDGHALKMILITQYALETPSVEMASDRSMKNVTMVTK